MPTKKQITIVVFTVLCVFLGILFYDWYSSFSHLFIVESPDEIAIKEKMSDPEYRTQFALRVALYCQSVNKLTGIGYYPEIAGDLPIKVGYISPDKAVLKIRGGFDHFGYMLVKDESQSTQEKNVWVFSTYGDRTEELCIITINKSDKILLPDIENMDDYNDPNNS
jgi:hypothetical protein